MKAVIMCGGLGSRLRPLTEVRPKPLMRVLGVPLLETIVSRVKDAGIEEIHLSLGYKADQIIDFCEQRFADSTLFFHTEGNPLGTAGGVKNCIGTSEEDILVLSGDNIFDFDLQKILHSHISSGADFTLVGTVVPDPREYGVVIADEKGRVLGFQEKPTWEKAEAFLVNTGMYVFKGPVLELIPEERPFDFSNDVFPLLLKNGARFRCCKAEGFWGDIGEPGALLEITHKLLSMEDLSLPFRGTLYKKDETSEYGGRIIAPSLIGKGSRILKNAVVGPFAVLGDDLLIGENAVVVKSILGDNVEIEEGAEASGAIADDNVSLGARTAVEEGSVLGCGVTIGNFSRVLPGCRIWPGRRVEKEEVVSRDLFFSTPLKLETDYFGIMGKPYAELTPADGVRIGQALASAKSVRRVGVGHDASKTAALFKDACATGIRAGNAICYDFEEMFRAQAWFYSAYCSLDAFVFISSEGENLRFSFYGENGLPMNERVSKEVSRNFRFSSFSFSSEGICGELFRMHLLSTAYSAGLRKIARSFLSDRRVTAQCENPLILSSAAPFFTSCAEGEEFPEIGFLFSEDGASLCCVEDGSFYTSESIRDALSERLLQKGRTVVLPEDAPEDLLAKNEARRVTENAENDVEANAFLESLWNFDAVFLSLTLLKALQEDRTTLRALTEKRSGMARRNDVFELHTDPALLRDRFRAIGARKETPGDVYYKTTEKNGAVRLRQLGNSGRVRILVEAASAETAKELSGDILRRLQEGPDKTGY